MKEVEPDQLWSDRFLHESREFDTRGYSLTKINDENVNK